MFSFSIVEFLLVLESYNLSIWPLQIFAYILIIIVLFFSFKSTNYAPKIVLSVLSFLWLFNGIAFCYLFWAPSHIFGYYLGHIYPKFFPVGLVPCPTTILTFGIFLIINNIPIKYYIIPLIISLGGFLAAYNGIYEDVGLIIAGILGTVLLMRSNVHFKKGDLKTS